MRFPSRFCHTLTPLLTFAVAVCVVKAQVLVLLIGVAAISPLRRIRRQG